MPKDPSNPATQADIDDLYRMNREHLDMLSKLLNDRMHIIEQSQGAFERQLATLIVGYGEMGILIEALVSRLDFDSEEAKQEFFDKQDTLRKEIFSALQRFTNALDGSDPDAAAAMAHGIHEHFNDLSEGGDQPTDGPS